MDHNELIGSWPDDERSDQVSLERQRDQLRVQEDLQEAWDHLMLDRWEPGRTHYTTESDIKLLKWALGI